MKVESNDPLSIFEDCGHVNAYRRHYRQNTVPCKACVEAHRVYQDNYRRSKRGGPPRDVPKVVYARTVNLPVTLLVDIYDTCDEQTRKSLESHIDVQLMQRYRTAAEAI